MRLKFDQISLRTAELAVLECVKKLIFCDFNTLVPSLHVLIGSLSFLHVTRPALISQMRLHFDRIGIL